MRKAPDILSPTFLSAGIICLSCTKRSRSTFWWAVALRAKMENKEDDAIVAAAWDCVSFFDLPLLRCALRVRTYVLRIACMRSRMSPSVVGVSRETFRGERAVSRWLQYHSHNQSRLSCADLLSSARDGRWRWTMLCRVSRRWVGRSRNGLETSVGNHEGFERRRSSCVSVKPVMNLGSS